MYLYGEALRARVFVGAIRQREFIMVTFFPRCVCVCIAHVHPKHPHVMESTRTTQLFIFSRDVTHRATFRGVKKAITTTNTILHIYISSLFIIITIILPIRKYSCSVV